MHKPLVTKLIQQAAMRQSSQTPPQTLPQQPTHPQTQPSLTQHSNIRSQKLTNSHNQMSKIISKLTHTIATQMT
jgi:hypothetical protein